MLMDFRPLRPHDNGQRIHHRGQGSVKQSVQKQKNRIDREISRETETDRYDDDPDGGQDDRLHLPPAVKEHTASQTPHQKCPLVQHQQKAGYGQRLS